MATTLRLTTLLLFSSLMVLALAHENPTDQEVGYVVQGTVHCQRCSMAGTWSLTRAKPLHGARVSIECRDNKHRVKFYKFAEADENGYYFMPLTGFDLKTFHVDSPHRVCTMHLVSSSNRRCNHLTNINHGIKGAPIRYESKLYNGTSYETDLYSSMPLAFRPIHCRPKHHRY